MSAIIELNDLSIRSKSQPIINGLSATISEGEFISVTGPSGSGKSTFLKYLAQLLDPALEAEGSYVFKDQAVSEIDPVTLRKQVSYCYQTPTLFGDTVRENLRFGYDIRDLDFNESYAKEMLDNVQLPTNYLDKEINTLSGGEKQRVALIRNVLFDPEVLLLDEITSALDTDTRDIIWAWLKDYRKQTEVTILMISHLEEEHTYSDRTIDIKKLTSAGEK
jgi:putative ABC transport system ATP-binding protein